MPEHGLDQVMGLQDRAKFYADDLKHILLELKAAGKTIWGLGAAAKATVFMNFAGIDDSLIDAVADDTPAKQGRYIPGTKVQVRSSEEWLKAAPDYTVIFTWNYAQVIAQKFQFKYYGELITSFMPVIHKGRR